MNRGSVLAALMVSITLFGCDKEGPMERAGEKIDQAAEKAGDEVENATNR
jgi:predicted small lipoprotein YifL